MPLYEYYCADCREKFDTIRPMSKADEPVQCKHCESMRTSRMLSLFAAPPKGQGNAGFTGPAPMGGGCCGGACGCGH